MSILLQHEGDELAGLGRRLEARRQLFEQLDLHLNHKLPNLGLEPQKQLVGVPATQSVGRNLLLITTEIRGVLATQSVGRNVLLITTLQG